MKNRREFLGGCAAAATVMAMPAASAVLAPAAADNALGMDGLKALQGERISLHEGGTIVVMNVEAVGTDPRWEQCLVQVLPSARMDSGIYHLQTPAGAQAVYLETGGSADRPTLTAAFSRLRG